MKFTDSHCHMHDARIAGNIPEIIQRARSAGVIHIVSCATMLNNFEKTEKLAEKYPEILPCLGIHPWFLDSLVPGWKSILGEEASKIACGIGETGLDFMKGNVDRDLQIQVFETHLSIANDLKRPVNIHIRKAWNAFIRILKKMGPLKVSGLIHSYSGSYEMIKILEKYNLYFSFSGSLTRPNVRKVIQAIQGVSLDRLLLETDAPDIYPSIVPDLKPFIQSPSSSPLNEPGNLPAIAHIAARIRSIEFDKFVKTVYQNSQSIFKPLLQ